MLMTVQVQVQAQVQVQVQVQVQAKPVVTWLPRRTQGPQCLDRLCTSYLGC
jgi:hypothetical protein